MTDRFSSYRPDGEPTADRWVGALHLFDADGGQGAEGAGGVVTLHQESAAERWQRAELLFAEKHYADAAKLLLGVVAEFPEHVAARLLLARAYYHSAQLRRAEEELRAVIASDPVEHYAHLMLGRTLERQGRRDEAARWLRMAGAFSGEDVAG
ncbi:tetratricopeptide repeat protein [Streptomyces sp. NBC_01476]|uniref:tetratricopeptide repeat protein n=1 Tax=Streptomyces sp. NBC_01476 TaxID=2903881 RepID=UPI002E36F9BA|nr:tetratricopeptide repeat protein [Streptomyces sp. NBC_01476]